ncbi:MAG: hypothetical protein HC817_02340 [Saprospiraceae bacterium]|nr:hypothetical protein [Saprospiraceae bacterium]
MNGGLVATCETCPRNLIPKITWWTAAVGGAQVFTGAIFDPIAVGLVDEKIVGNHTFFAQCACGACVSERTPSVFTVNPQPKPIIQVK